MAEIKNNKLYLNKYTHLMLRCYFRKGRNNPKILYKRQNKLTCHETSVFLTTVLILFHSIGVASRVIPRRLESSITL